MPRLTVFMVRAALLHMGVGFSLGAILLWNKGAPFAPQAWRLLNPHIEMLLIGWTLQLAMGVAYWILPRFPGERRYGRAWLGWLALLLINTGVILTAVSHWQGADWNAGLLIGYGFKLTAVAAYVLLMWPRVKPFATEPVPLWKRTKAEQEQAAALKARGDAEKPG
jgi:hypothetical protein